MKARTKLTLILAGAAAALALGSLAGAAIVDGNGTIHGCYDKNSGQLRVADTATNLPKSCTVKEAALTWSQQGPQGPQGPKGDQGDPGPSQATVLSRPAPKAVGLNTIVGGLSISGQNLISAKVVIGTTQHDFSIPFCSLYAGPDLLDRCEKLFHRAVLEDRSRRRRQRRGLWIPRLRRNVGGRRQRHALLGPGSIAGHRAVREALCNCGRIVFHILVPTEVKGEAHPLNEL